MHAVFPHLLAFQKISRADQKIGLETKTRYAREEKKKSQFDTMLSIKLVGGTTSFSLKKKKYVFFMTKL